MEGVAFQMRWAIEYGEDFGQPMGSIRAVGGGTIGTQWLQIIADVIGRPLQVVKDPQDAAAVGAAACALVGLGLQPDFGFLDERVAIERTYVPDRERAAGYTDRFATYRSLYDALAPIYHGSTRQVGAGSRW
jgi:xylulokinase